jgi:hypothetical protein
MVEAAGVDQIGESRQGRSRLAGYAADSRPNAVRNGGGGGSRTRVRKHVVVGLYMRVRFVIVGPGVWKRLSTVRP